jgi:DNA-binding beta-propeller fold protein YncE
MKKKAPLIVCLIAACGAGTACGTKTPPPVSNASAPASSSSALASAIIESPPPGATPAASAVPSTRAPIAANGGPAQLTGKPLPLPGATAPVVLDYVVYDRERARVWVPVADTASVDVLDVVSGSFTRVDGFKNGERAVHGKTRKMGPSAVTVGDGFVYIGNRATNEVCAVDASTQKLGNCLKLPSSIDGVAYVPSAKEVWVTTPHDQSIAVLDASQPAALKSKTTIKFDGAPEGYAIDDSRGVFFTNLEDKDRTVVIDTKTHKQRGAPWKPECGPNGPRGIAADVARGFVYVACTDQVHVLDTKDGAILAKVDAGAGVDNIDWLETHRLLYVGAARAAKLSVFRVDDKGQPTLVATGASGEGARNAVADASGNAYLPDPANARILVFSFTP